MRWVQHGPRPPLPAAGLSQKRVLTQAANEANIGAVAIVAKRGLKTITCEVSEQETELYNIALWKETKFPVNGRTKYITVARSMACQDQRVMNRRRR